MIELNDALKKIRDTIEVDITHPYYKESISIAEFAKATESQEAEDQKEYIFRYRRGETEKEKEQRLELTTPVTSVPLGMTYAYLEEVYRTDGIKKKADHSNEKIKELIDENFKRFYHGESLHEYLHRALFFLNRFDPNGWVIFESKLIEGARGEREALTMYPIIATSEEALDFRMDETGQLEYLTVRFDRPEMYVEEGKKYEDDFQDFYLYGQGFNIHYAQVKLDFNHERDYEAEGYQLTKVKNDDYYFRVFETGTEEVPAIRGGAYKSGYHENRICETFVAPANPILKLMMGETSLFDTQKAIHIFPDKWEYTKPCNYTHEQYGQCDGGFYSGIKKEEYRCTACSGTGQLINTTEQRIKRMAWPKTQEQLLDLAKMSHYVERPIEIVEFFERRVDKLTAFVKLVTFNQESIDLAMMKAKTATEVAIQTDRINNKLSPFAQKTARAWELAHRLLYQMYGQDNPEAEMIHPADYKLKTVRELTVEYQEAKDAGMPNMVLWSITKDILAKQHRNSPETVKEIEAFERWKPWRDKSDEQVFFIIQSRSQDDPDRQLWENWDKVMRIVKRDSGEVPFYLKEEREQEAAIVAALAQAVNGVQYQGLSESLIDEPLGIEQ